MIPSFRTVADAAAYAEQHKPFRAALERPLPADYASQYGRHAYYAAVNCRLAARHGDMRRLHIGSLALSLSVNPPMPSGRRNGR